MERAFFLGFAHEWWILNLIKNLQPVQGFQQLHGHQAHPTGETGKGGLAWWDICNGLCFMS